MTKDLFPSPPHHEEEWLSWLRLLGSRRVGPATFFRLEYGSADDALWALPEIAWAAGVKDYRICPETVALAEMRADPISVGVMPCGRRSVDPRLGIGPQRGFPSVRKSGTGRQDQSTARRHAKLGKLSHLAILYPTSPKILLQCAEKLCKFLPLSKAIANLDTGALTSDH